jgi:hypothetical protein
VDGGTEANAASRCRQRERRGGVSEDAVRCGGGAGSDGAP